MRGRALALLAALGLGLAACSSGEVKEVTALGEAFSIARGLLAQRLGGGGAAGPAVPGALPAGLSRAALAGVEEPMLLANVDSIGAAATLRQARHNEGFITWASADKVTVTTRGGIVTATRGLPADLLSADAAPLLAALAGGPATYTRALRTLGGDRQILRSRLNCRLEQVGVEQIEVLEISHQTRHLAETCTDAAGGTLRNDFWLGAGGTLWKSRQFLNPQLGYITLQTLIE